MPKQRSNSSLKAQKSFSKSRGVSAAYSQRFSSKEPRIAYSRSGCCVAHTELLGDIAGTDSPDFIQSKAFQLNPGLASFTPWLANIAQNYESYRCKKLIFRYVTKTGSTTAGSVMMIPDYNASDAAPLSEQLAANYIDVQEDVPWVQEGITCVLRPQAMHKLGPQKFVRTGPLSPNLDIKTYDVGSFWIFTINSSVAVGWGKLWVDYEFEFETPTNKSLATSSEFWTVEYSSNGGEDQPLPLGTTPIISGGIVTEYDIGSGTIVFQGLTPGQYYYVSTTLTGTAITSPIQVENLVNFTSIGSDQIFNTAGTESLQIALLQATSASASFEPGVISTTVTNCLLIFSIAPNNIFPLLSYFEKKKAKRTIKKKF
jgi:hypothetical protein